METIVPNPKPPLHHLNSSITLSNRDKKINLDYATHNFIPKTPIQIHLPLHRPEFNPPKRVKIKPPLKESNFRPITTTSEILHLLDSLKLTISLDIYDLLVKECTELGDPFKAVELYDHMRKSRVRFSLPLLNRVLIMYVSCGCLENARQLFDQMFVRDLNSWAIMIAGFCENGGYSESICLFTKMMREEEFGDFFDDKVTFLVTGMFVFVLRACVNMVDLELGMQVHSWLCKTGYSKDVVLCSSLIDFYGKMKCSGDGWSIFEHSCSQNTVVWTATIVNICRDGNFEGAVSVFKEMGRKGVRRNEYTLSNVVKACGRMRDVGCGQQVHANAIKLGLQSDGYVQCALIDLYGKCGLLHDATRAFEMKGARRNGACCNAIVTNYVQHGFTLEAIRILDEMKRAGLEPCKSLLNKLDFF